MPSKTKSGSQSILKMTTQLSRMVTACLLGLGFSACGGVNFSSPAGSNTTGSSAGGSSATVDNKSPAPSKGNSGAKDKDEFETAASPKNVSGSYLVGTCDEMPRDHAHAARRTIGVFAIECSFKSNSGLAVEGPMSSARVEMVLKDGRKFEPATLWYQPEGSNASRLVVLVREALLPVVESLSLGEVVFSEKGGELKVENLSMTMSEPLQQKIISAKAPINKDVVDDATTVSLIPDLCETSKGTGFSQCKGEGKQ